MTVKAASAMARGSQAPCTILVRFAARKSPSTTSKIVAPEASSHRGVRQVRLAT